MTPQYGHDSLIFSTQRITNGRILEFEYNGGEEARIRQLRNDADQKEHTMTERAEDEYLDKLTKWADLTIELFIPVPTHPSASMQLPGRAAYRSHNQIDEDTDPEEHPQVSVT